MESVDRLREWANGVGMMVGMSLRDARDHINAALDAIEAEVAEWYVELPVDAEGVPIRHGDTVYGEDGHEWRVTYILIGRNHSVRATDGTGCRALRPEWLSHRRPTVEHELGEMHNDLLRVWQSDMDNAFRQDRIDEIIAEYAAKLRIAGGDE